MGRRGGHGGGHGGAWKVAYADFVTSMMALFLVLWLVGSDVEIREAVQEYFRGEKSKQGKPAVGMFVDSKPFLAKPQDQASTQILRLEEFKKAMEQLREQLNNSQESGDEAIRFEFIADGVRITALDKSKRPFFESGTSDLTEYGKWVLTNISWELERYPSLIEVEGHTQKGGEPTGAITDSWQLSTSRAYEAQKLLEKSGLKDSKFWRVAGYADKVPMNEANPAGEENRRISIVIRPKEEGEVRDLVNELRLK